MKNFTKYLSLILISSQVQAASYTRFSDTITSGTAQIGTTTAANSKAALEITSTTKGFLPPRMTGAQRDAITSPPTGLVVFNTTTNKLNAYNGTSWVEVGSGAGGLYSEGQNLISNSSFATDTTGWTSTGTGTGCTGSTSFARTTTNGQFIPPGVAGACFDAGASSETLVFTATTINANDGLAGRSGVVSVALRADSGTATHVLQAYDGSNVLASVTVTSSTTVFTRTSLNFSFPASGTVQFRLVSAANEPVVYIDDVFMGLAEGFNIANVSQATFWGYARWPGTASCSWSTTGTSFASFSADSDCTNPAGSNLAGYAEAPATKIPAIKFSNLPPGEYQIFAKWNNGSGGGPQCYARLTDGTNHQNQGSLPSGDGLVSAAGRFTYTAAQSSVTFEVQEYRSGGTSCAVSAGGTDADLQFWVYRFPTSSELAYRPEKIPGIWAGYHDSNCAWTTTSSSYADPSDDGSCTFTERTNTNFGTVSAYGSTGPGLTFTPTVAGKYEICAYATVENNNGGSGASLQLYDGTSELAALGVETAIANSGKIIPICGIVTATSTAAKSIRLRMAASSNTMTMVGFSPNRSIEWTIKPTVQNMPVPLVIGSVSSNSAGTERIERAYITGGNPPSIAQQSGAWLTYSSRTGAGDYTFTITSGLFSATPTCHITSKSATRRFARFQTVTTTSLRTGVEDSAGTGQDDDQMITCMGAR